MSLIFRSAGIPATSSTGHRTQYGTPIPTISSADDADACVAARTRDGSDYLKIILNGVRTFRFESLLPQQNHCKFVS